MPTTRRGPGTALDDASRWRSSSSRRATTACRSRRSAYDVTPVGLHYLLIHFDIPAADAATWTLRGRRARRAAARRSRSTTCARARRVTLAGDDGVRRQRPRAPPPAAAQPAVAAEAVGTAEWTGTPLAPILAEAGLGRTARRARLHGRRPRHPGRGRARLRAQPAARRGDARRGPARVRDERPAAPAAARLPAAAARPGLVRHDEREVAARDHGGRRAVRRVPAGGRYRIRAREDDPGTPVTRIDAARADGAAGLPGLLHAARGPSRPGPCTLEGRAWSGAGRSSGSR